MGWEVADDAFEAGAFRFVPLSEPSTRLIVSVDFDAVGFARYGGDVSDLHGKIQHHLHHIRRRIGIEDSRPLRKAA